MAMCLKCGAQVTTDAAICSECGSPLKANAETQPDSQRAQGAQNGRGNTETFCVVLEGKCLDGFDSSKVQADLARLTRQNESTVASQLSGHATTVKSGTDKITGERYLSALRAIGVACHLDAEMLEFDVVPEPRFAPPKPSISAASPFIGEPTHQQVENKSRVGASSGVKPPYFIATALVVIGIFLTTQKSISTPLWFWLLNIAIALWVVFDAQSRRADKSVLWAIGTAFLMIFIIPFYLAKRPLKDGEVREGGTAWNVIKSFAIFWTVFMFVAGVSGMMTATEHMSKIDSSAGQAGAAIGTAIGMTMIIGLWFVVVAGALIIGLFLKKSSIVENGPTGDGAKTSFNTGAYSAAVIVLLIGSASYNGVQDFQKKQAVQAAQAEELKQEAERQAIAVATERRRVEREQEVERQLAASKAEQLELARKSAQMLEANKREQEEVAQAEKQRVDAENQKVLAEEAKRKALQAEAKERAWKKYYVAREECNSSTALYCLKDRANAKIKFQNEWDSGQIK